MIPTGLSTLPLPSPFFPPAAPNLHAMDCTDVVIGVARGQQFRVFDYYTRDRSTPRRDSFYGGIDSITAAVGAEIDGFTTIKWRKRLQAAGG